MRQPKPEKPYKYKVILLMPENLKGAKNAETLLQQALEVLNTHRLGPGFRFSDDVVAALEVAHDKETVLRRAREKDLALVIACGFPQEELTRLAHNCRSYQVQFCHAREIPPDDHGVNARFIWTHGKDLVKAPGGREIIGHEIEQTIFTNAISDDHEEFQSRIFGAIQILAMGVMSAHSFKHDPPRRSQG